MRAQRDGESLGMTGAELDEREGQSAAPAPGEQQSGREAEQQADRREISWAHAFVGTAV